jgi:hypothetical protein
MMAEGQILDRLTRLESAQTGNQAILVQALEGLRDNLHRLERRLIGESGTNGEIGKLKERMTDAENAIAEGSRERARIVGKIDGEKSQSKGTIALWAVIIAGLGALATWIAILELHKK